MKNSRKQAIAISPHSLWYFIFLSSYQILINEINKGKNAKINKNQAKVTATRESKRQEGEKGKAGKAN